MLKTKIEVLLDKIQLVMEEAGDKLTDMDKRLLSRYASQIVSILDIEQPTRRRALSSAVDKGRKVEDSVAQKADTGLKRTLPQENKLPLEESLDREEAPTIVEPQQEDDRPKEMPEEKEEVFGFLHPEDEERKRREKSEVAFKDIAQSLEAIKEANRKKIALLEEEKEDENEDAGDASPSLNDRFKDEQAVLIDQLKEQPIANLQLEIDLNDKFWFVSELFEGDATAFGNLLKSLDRADNLESALQLLGEKIDLNQEGQAVQKLLRLVKRRFLST